jgi:hypothetical protein
MKKSIQFLQGGNIVVQDRNRRTEEREAKTFKTTKPKTKAEPQPAKTTTNIEPAPAPGHADLAPPPWSHIPATPDSADVRAGPRWRAASRARRGQGEVMKTERKKGKHERRIGEKRSKDS